MARPPSSSISFFFNDTATTEIYTLSLHDALPISPGLRGGNPSKQNRSVGRPESARAVSTALGPGAAVTGSPARSEEHTSELQSQFHLVCRLLLEKKKKKEAQQKQRKNSEKSKRLR